MEKKLHWILLMLMFVHMGTLNQQPFTVSYVVTEYCETLTWAYAFKIIK